MERKTYNRYAYDALLGMIVGAIMFFDMKVYVILFFAAVIGALVMLLLNMDLSAYGNDENGEFSLKVVLYRALAVSIGVLMGQYAPGLAF